MAPRREPAGRFGERYIYGLNIDSKKIYTKKSNLEEYTMVFKKMTVKELIEQMRRELQDESKPKAAKKSASKKKAPKKKKVAKKTTKKKKVAKKTTKKKAVKRKASKKKKK